MWCMCWHIRPEAPPWNWQPDKVHSNNSDAPNVLHCLHFGPHILSDSWRLESAGCMEARSVDQRPSSPLVTPPTRYLADHKPQILVFIYGHCLQHVHIDRAQNLVELLCLFLFSVPLCHSVPDSLGKHQWPAGGQIVVSLAQSVYAPQRGIKCSCCKVAAPSQALSTCYSAHGCTILEKRQITADATAGGQGFGKLQIYSRINQKVTPEWYFSW